MTALFSQDAVEILARLLMSLTVGAFIGLERSYNGRPAGFRTHALVCVSSALLMLMTTFEDAWIAVPQHARLVLDPTRMGQGIMTGIGFLGAGAIIKSGPSIRGLTTAASIWITAAIGILVGVGFYLPAIAATAITLGVLSVFRRIEALMPTVFYAELVVRFARDARIAEETLRGLIGRQGFSTLNLHYRLNHGDDYFEYRMGVRSFDATNASRLVDALSELQAVKDFRLSPTGD